MKSRTRNEHKKIRQILPCYALRYYGQPADTLSLHDKIWISRKKEIEEEKRVNALLESQEMPDNLTEKEFIDFLYLRACLYMNKKPAGDFEGDAKICADVMSGGGNIVDMYKAGAGAVYCACLSHHKLDPAIQQKIIDAHIPF